MLRGCLAVLFFVCLRVLCGKGFWAKLKRHPMMGWLQNFSVLVAAGFATVSNSQLLAILESCSSCAFVYFVVKVLGFPDSGDDGDWTKLRPVNMEMHIGTFKQHGTHWFHRYLRFHTGTVLGRVDSPLRAHLRFAGLLAWQHGRRSPATGNLPGNSPR
jgi:hypothetical protein